MSITEQQSTDYPPEKYISIIKIKAGLMWSAIFFEEGI